MTELEWDELPRYVQDIMEEYNHDCGDLYKEAERIISLLEEVGWSADYGLDGVLIDVEKK
jgi:hypothetical protein